MSKAAAALAHELGNHIDDLVDSDETKLQTADGDDGCEVQDTLPQPNDHSFLVQCADGSILLVEVREIEKPLEYNCYGGQWTVHAAHDYDLASGRKAHCPGKTADNVLGAKPAAGTFGPWGPEGRQGL